MEGNFKLKADLHPELFIFGTVLSGDHFDCRFDGLSCDLQFTTGENWELLSDAGLIQTQISLPSSDNHEYVWSQPFELFYSPTSLEGWPVGLLQVWRSMGGGRMNSVSYGRFVVPFEEGPHIVQCQTWSPVGDCRSSDLVYYFGCYPQLKNVKILSINDEKLAKLNCSGSGNVSIELTVVKRNFSR